jgi:Ca2+-binding RTX toxin-like protein
VISSVSHTLANGVENLTLASGAGNINGTGNALDNTIVGNEGNNILTGGAGADTLTGNAGADVFLFNALNEGVDNITDFTSGVDKLEFLAAGFGGGLTANTTPALVSAADIATANHAGSGGYFIFDNSDPNKGTVYWDATGGSGTDAVAIVKLAGVSALLASDLFIV